jgi:hypothetical protein
MRISIVVALFVGVQAVSHKEEQKEGLSLFSRMLNMFRAEVKDDSDDEELAEVEQAITEALPEADTQSESEEMTVV